jgi:hypothetical protein
MFDDLRHIYLLLDFMMKASVSMVTAMRRRRITMPHTVPVMIISISELD